jgi:hypothetical protein
MPFSSPASPDQLYATAADGGLRRRPGWRREQIVWVFQVLFWLAVGATLSGFSVALRPGEPLPWGAIGLRVVTGFAVSSLIDMLFRLPALRALPRAQRWPLLVIVAVLGMAMTLVTSLLLLREDGICDRQRARVAARSGQAMASPVELASAGATRAESAASNAPTAMVLAAASLLGPAKAMKSWTNALGSDKTGAARWVMRPAW